MDDHGLSEADAFSLIQKRAMQDRRRCGRSPSEVIVGRAHARTPRRRRAAHRPAHRRQLAHLPRVLRPAHRPGHRVGPGHQRGVRLHVDAHQPAPRPPARRASPWPSTGPSPRSATSGSPPTRPTATPAPDILRQQMGLVRQVVESLRHPDRSRWPASRPTTSSPRSPPRAATAGDDVIIVTGDRDSYQLVEDPHIKVLYNKRGVSDYALYDEAGIARAHRRHARALPAVRRAAGRPVRQPARRARGGGEDRGQADQHLRRPRRHLRARRRADAEAAREPRPRTRPTSARTPR